MSKQLAIALRPRTFKDLFGQAKMASAIENQISSGRVPNAFLFIGETGSGKTTTARILARALACPRQKGPSFLCKRECCASDHFSEINVAKKNTVEAISQIAESSVYAPAPPAIRRVYVLNEAQRVTSQAQSVLLEYTEHPPATTIWIFTTTDPQKMLTALRGRCITYALAPLRGKVVDAFVKHAVESTDSDRELAPFIDQIHTLQISSARVILQGLEKFLSGMDPDVALTMADSDVDTKRICRNLVAGDWGPIRSELEKMAEGESRNVRSAVLGYLTSIMLNRQTTANRDAVTVAIKELSAIGYQDEVAQKALLVSTLWKLSKKF